MFLTALLVVSCQTWRSQHEFASRTSVKTSAPAFRTQLETVSRGYDGEAWPPKTIIPPDNKHDADKSV